MSPPTVDIAMLDPSPEPIFEETIEAVQSTLSEDERRFFRHYADSTSMLEDVRAMCAANQKEHHRLLTCSRKIALFSHAFAPYFDIINIYVQIRPDWLGWFWGSIRLVFKLGSAYVLFLEKIADMFETVAMQLPQYQQFHHTCKGQFQETQQDRVTTLMSYVYADIVQFCLELYRMFSRGSPGVKLRHRAGFLTTVLWRPLDSRFSQLQQRLAKHKQWFETEMGVHTFELLAQHRQELVNVQNVLKTHSEVNGELEAGRMMRRSKRVDRVKTWLSSGEYRLIYEQSVRQRHSDSCSWFLDAPKYCRWKNAPFDERDANDLDVLKGNWHDRVLFVQAKPGFGKTLLSGRIIEDLSTAAEDLNISDEPPSTVFFHFSSVRPNRSSSHDALRALAVQLVHKHRHDHPTLDALALLMRKASGQQKASTDDVVAVLALLLRQHSTFLVIDGMDECIDADVFLTLLPEICRISDCRVIILSRPTITIPLEYQKWASDCPHIISLNDSHNATDIDAFLMTNLGQMADQGYFGISMDRSIFDNVGRRSDGMFLWASLLVRYLQSPGLSPNERRKALEQASLLEGLEPLYRSILNMLAQRYGKEKRIAADIFRWLALSIRPLSLTALHTALAIIPGQPTAKDQYLLHFTDSISRLTCALVEVTDGNVDFIHRSVKEYLESPDCAQSDFSLFDESAVHAHLAARCISYLANDVPKQPLQRLEPYRPSASISASSGVSFRTSRSADSGYKSMPASDTEGLVEPEVPQPTVIFDANLPFLRYAALCWPVHLYRALGNRTPRCTSQTLSTKDPFSNTPWLPTLSHFLTDRAAVTTWVEASWRYNLPPNLSRLVPLLLTTKSEIPPATIEGRELKWVVHGLRQLSDALNELRGDYGFTLKDNPSLLWQWNIQAATEGGFWPVWDERTGRVHGLEA
ncbi:hypothetical protein BCR34DRAFT_306723 [Clohesyomyces aquaticus]|uniref:Uncharacterized protein n=1 Tax=Clohesyomyces aquaticus TaxID=1231657 RepID=A0A1Y1ZPU5_9PLEO|nr:hypothetical protein BCR34DRAFT_306723 [Clohesyomyces aquaticus]